MPIWRPRAVSKLVQIMGCCLITSSQYFTLYWHRCSTSQNGTKPANASLSWMHSCHYQRLCVNWGETSYRLSTIHVRFGNITEQFKTSYDTATLSVPPAIWKGNTPLMTCGSPSQRTSNVEFWFFFFVCKNKLVEKNLAIIQLRRRDAHGTPLSRVRRSRHPNRRYKFPQ